MKDVEHDYLWNPDDVPEPDIVALEAHLQSFSAQSLRLGERRLPLPTTPSHRLRWWMGIAAALATVFVGSVLFFQHRLEWPSAAPWHASITTNANATRTLRLELGQSFETRADETARLEVARIGSVVVAPNSVVNLAATGKGRHRLQLEHGRLRAKVWAPPGYFGVNAGSDVAVDLGCEFDIVKEIGGRGSLTVSSGWVLYVRGAEETLIPEGYGLSFDADAVSTPVRANADHAFRDLTVQLDLQLRQATPDSVRIDTLADRIATTATSNDTFTLLSLLSRHPELARTSLYPRLAAALNVSLDDVHRSRWLRDDMEAKNQWWNRLPKQPKRWWLHWRDAL